MIELKTNRTLPSRLVIGLCLVLLFAMVTVLAPWFAPYDPYAQDLAMRLQPPVWSDGGDWSHPFGTDGFGRDYLSRLIYGGRISISIAVIVVAISAPIGILLGLAGGYYGGFIDNCIMFIITTRLSLPVVLVTLAIVSITGGSFITAALVLGFLFWDRFAIVIRAATQQLRTRQFVLSARATGASHVQVLAREILPNVGLQALAIATVEMAHAILVEAALSFLGLGVQPPAASWGLMVAEARDLFFFLPHLVVIPGLAICLLVLGINLISDGLQPTRSEY